MSDTIWVALIGLAGSIAVALISYFAVKQQNKKQDNKFDTFQNDVRTDIKTEMQIAQAITNNEIKHLTEEVRKHNNFAQKIPVIEKEIEDIQKDIDGIKDKLNQV